MPLWALLLALPDAGAVLSRPIQISASHQVFTWRDRKAVYTGQVRVVRDSTTLTCERLEVTYDSVRDDILTLAARGQVQATDGDRVARGEEATYDNTRGVLVARGSPRAIQGAREVEGEEVTFTTGTDRLVVTKARTRVEDPKASPKGVQIRAEELVLEGTASEATWNGKVRAVRGSTVLTAPTLTARYDEQGTITRIRAPRGVEATDGDRWAKGERADYDARAGVLVVTGKPEARQGTTRMRGTKVTLYSESEVVDVENATAIIEVDKRPR